MPSGPLRARWPACLVERAWVSAATLKEGRRRPLRAPRRPNRDDPPVKGPLESMSVILLFKRHIEVSTYIRESIRYFSGRGASPLQN